MKLLIISTLSLVWGINAQATPGYDPRTVQEVCTYYNALIAQCMNEIELQFAQAGHPVIVDPLKTKEALALESGADYCLSSFLVENGASLSAGSQSGGN